MIAKQTGELRSLSEDRLAEVGSDPDDVVELTPEVRALLDERIAHANAHPDDVLTWDEMKADLGWK